MLLRHHCLIIHPFLKAKENPIKHKWAQCQTWTQQLIWSNTKLEAQGTELRLPFRGGFELPGWSHVKRKPWEIFMCRLRRGEERERLAGLRLNSTWTPSNFPRGHHKSFREPEEARGGGGCNVQMCIIPKREDERVEDERQKRGADSLLTCLHFQ